MQQIILGGLFALIITFLAIPAIITIAKKKKLYDEPDGVRKFHKEPIPALGGLGIFVGFIISILLTLNFSTDAPEFQYYIVSFLLIFFLGVKDDIMILSANKKFLGQVLVACILIFKAHLLITNMEGIFGVYELNTFCSYSLTIFAIVVIINAFNLIDGVDGLAAGLGLISSLIFGTIFFLNHNIPYALLSFTFAGSLIAFLYYNFYPATIFMGDAGSLMIGLVSSILVIKFIQVGSSFKDYPVTASPAVGFGILLLPLMDTLRVFTIRVINGRSPFSPDRNHIHHLLLKRGFNHATLALTCFLSTILISIAAFAFQAIGAGMLITMQMILFFSLVSILNYKKPKYKFKVIKGEINDFVKEGKAKLVPLFDLEDVALGEEAN